MTEVIDEPTTALTLPQRAEVALGESANVAKLRELAAQSASILAVTNQDGREQAHRAAMVLRTTRTNITSTGKTAREDAVAFGKAVIALEKDLIAIIEPEEARLIQLRDSWDAAEQARKDALIAAERARVQAIQDHIQLLAHLPVRHAACTAEQLSDVITEYDGWTPDAAVFEEFADKAQQTVALSLMALRDLLTARQQQEQRAAESEAARLAEIARIDEERRQLAIAQAEAARVASELSAERQRLAAEAAAQQAAETERKRIADAAAKAERDAAAARTAQVQAELDEQCAELAEQQRAFAAKQLAAEQAALLELDHAEALDMNAEIDLVRAAAPALVGTAPVIAIVDEIGLVDLADAAEPMFDIPPISDNEIIERVASFLGLDYQEAVDRLEAIDFEAAREVDL